MNSKNTAYGLRYMKAAQNIGQWSSVAEYINANYTDTNIAGETLHKIANGKNKANQDIADIVAKEILKSRYINLKVSEEVESLYKGAGDAKPSVLPSIIFHCKGLIKAHEHDLIETAHIIDALVQSCFISGREPSNEEGKFIRDLSSLEMALAYCVRMEKVAEKIILKEDRTVGGILKAKAIYNQSAISLLISLETGLDLWNNALTKEVAAKYAQVMEDQLPILTKITPGGSITFGYALSVALPVYEIYSSIDYKAQAEAISKKVISSLREEENNCKQATELTRRRDITWLLKHEAADSTIKRIRTLVSSPPQTMATQS